MDRLGNLDGTHLRMRPAAEVGAEPEPERLAADFARLALELHTAGGVDNTLDAVVHFALQAINCTHAGVALSLHGKPQNTVTDPVIAQLYDFQLEQCRGPMITACREQRRIWVHDTKTESRWPAWAELATRVGVRTVMQLPLRIGDRTVGALGLFRPDPDSFSVDDAAVAHILARHASVAVATARRETELAEAMDARKLVGLAMGILMERYGLDEARAFEVLKRYSQSTNTKLRDVAVGLIATRKLPTGPGGS